MLRSDQAQPIEGGRGESFPPAAGGIFTLRSALAILAVFFVLAYLAPLNLSGLWQPDETRYGEISREMVTSGDWIAPRLLGVRYFEKPVAGYWINNISQLAFGENNFSVRFGSAASTGLSAVLIFCLAMLLWRERQAAFASALVYLSMLLVAGIGTYSVLDPMLTLWMTASMVCSWLALRAGTRTGRAGAWILLGLACGMGFLTKGFVALAIPVVAVLPVYVRERRFLGFVCYGPLAVACAGDAREKSAVQRIVLTRPAVEAGERLGFLPGDLTQKVDPYLRPLYDALYDLMGFDKVAKAFERGALEIAPLGFMRGRTLNHAFVILDEAQNTTPEQMKMFLTRIGFGAKAVVTGDVSQIDLPKNQLSGLIDAERVLRRVKGIAMCRLTSADVVRHPLVARIVDAYDQRGRSTGARSAAE